ncbi:MAG: UDP-3-O-acyl-N-acetylglucosamine deacetylase [Nitrospirae bacterium]|nr:UDP-3-O-acyl-N-acetylglucosamine deacetylase [Candidatus Manganitrophaceae bacterium]
MASMMLEKTIKKEVSCTGVGLHTGKQIQLSLIPADKGEGIVFVRRDLGGIRIPANAEHVVPSNFATILEAEGATVQTVEHLLAAVSAMEIDNLVIDLNGAEVPALDGSAFPFIALLQKAGLVEQNKKRSFIEILKPIGVSEKGKSVTIHPGSAFEVSCHIDFAHPLIAKQSYHYWHGRSAFISELSSARTFGFLKDYDFLKEQGLALGGSLDNTVVVGEDEILNEKGLRYADEFVRHKVLDLIGDFVMLGKPILGRLEAHCSGHNLHAKLVQAIIENKKAWRIVDMPTATSSSPVCRALPIRIFS